MSQDAGEVQVAVQESDPDPGPSPRRSSIEKPPVLSESDLDRGSDDDVSHPTAFDTLPEEIIQQ